MTALLYGPVEQAVKLWLTGTDVAPLVSRGAGLFNIFLAMPTASPKPVVLISLISGGPTQGADLPTTRYRISFDVIAKTRDEANLITRTLVSELDALGTTNTGAMPAGVYLGAADVLTMRWQPDPDSDTPRYIVDALITTVL